MGVTSQHHLCCCCGGSLFYYYYYISLPPLQSLRGARTGSTRKQQQPHISSVTTLLCGNTGAGRLQHHRPPIDLYGDSLFAIACILRKKKGTYLHPTYLRIVVLTFVCILLTVRKTLFHQWTTCFAASAMPLTWFFTHSLLLYCCCLLLLCLSEFFGFVRLYTLSVIMYVVRGLHPGA